MLVFWPRFLYPPAVYVGEESDAFVLRGKRAIAARTPSLWNPGVRRLSAIVIINSNYTPLRAITRFVRKPEAYNWSVLPKVVRFG